MSKNNIANVKEIIGDQERIRNISIIAHIDSGKCFGAGTQIMMSDGRSQNVEDIKNGDFVMTYDMKSGKVSNYHSGKSKMYKVICEDMNDFTYRVNGEHILVFKVVEDHKIVFNETDNVANLYYFYNNKLVINKQKLNTLSKFHLHTQSVILATTTKCLTLAWKNLKLKLPTKLHVNDSWVKVSVKDYLDYPDDVKEMLSGIRINLDGKYKYDSVNVTVQPDVDDNYYGFEVMNNPMFLLENGLVVHNSTLSDSLIMKAGFLAPSKAGKMCLTDTRDDEKERGITIKACSVSLYYQLRHDVMGMIGGQKFLINLIDSPGHVDFSSEVTASLRVTDGAVVVVECIGGVSVQTETVVRQAIQENIQMVLMINKLDRAIMELRLSPEELYLRIVKIIEDMNVLLSIYGGEGYRDNYFDPLSGNVVFGSAYHGWAFHLPQVANMYLDNNKVKPEVRESAYNKFIKKLWGEYFINDQGKWSQNPNQGVRGFVKLIMSPVYQVYQIRTHDKNPNSIIQKLINMNVKVEMSDLTDLEPVDIVRNLMRTWLPAGDAVLETVVVHLPSPVVAQKYRGGNLYTGDINSEVGQAIVNCDANGPMTMFVSKMFPANDNRFYAFGRIFSGTIKPGQKIKIMGGNYVYGEKHDMVEDKNIQQVVLMMAKSTEKMDAVPCGNIVGLSGIDQYMSKTGTLSDSKEAHPIRPMKYSVSPVVRVAVEPVDIKNLSKLQNALKKLATSDPLVVCGINKEGENIIAGAGELHVEICINDLKKLTGFPINISEPVVPYCETITKQSPVIYANSNSGLTRIFMRASPLNPDLIKDIDDGVIDVNKIDRQLVKTLQQKYNVNVNDIRKLWCFGTEVKTCLLTDSTKGVDYLDKVKKLIMTNFDTLINKSILIKEPMRGIHFELVDAQIHSDNAHRGDDEIGPAVRKSMYGCLLSGDVRIVEPIYLTEVYCPSEISGQLYGFMNQRRGTVIEEIPSTDIPMTLIKANLPVSESFGFTNKLREMSHGKAFPTCVFDHWSVVDSDAYEENSYASQVVGDIRKRRGLSEVLPDIAKYSMKMPKEFSDKYST